MTDLPDVQTVDRVELTRYLGDWFEICRLPFKWEDDNAADITASYSLREDGGIHVDNRCLDGEGKPTQSIGEANPVDDTNAKLLVSFLPEFIRWIPFTKGDYWILKLADDYSISLVGTPDRSCLWLLARQHQLPDDVFQAYIAEAARQGFDVTRLIFPRQSGHRVSDPSFK